MFRSSQPSDLNFFQAIQQQVLGFPVLLLNANATCWASSLCLCLKQRTDKLETERLTDIIVWNKQRWNLKYFKWIPPGHYFKAKILQRYDYPELREKWYNSRHDYDVNNVQDDFQSNMGLRLSKWKHGTFYKLWAFGKLSLVFYLPTHTNIS